jgi:flagellar hook-length control protein FliK
VSEQGPAPLVAANGTAPIQIPAPAAPVLNAAAGKPADEVRPASPHTKRETGRLRSAKSGDSPLPEALPARVVVTSQPAQPIPMTAALAPPPPAAARGKAADAGAGHAASRAVTGATARLIDPIAGNTPPAPTADAATALFADVKEAAKVAPEQAEPGISAPAAEAIALGARPASSHPRELQHATRTETAHVARTEPEIPARPGVLGRSLGVEIGRSIANGEETLRVRLNPPALGRIDVTIAFDDTGSLRATMSAETPRALEMLRGDSVELGRALDQAGVRADAQSFRFESRAGSGDGQSSPQRRQEAPPPARGSATSDINLIPELVYRPIRGDGRVDLLA